MLNIIAAISENGVIGKDNKLPWVESYPIDLKRFKRLTLGCTVIMGRKTWESMGCKPLKWRYNIVITSEEYSKKFNGACISRSIEDALLFHEEIKGINDKDHAWFIGGASIYKEALKHAQLIDLTYIPETIEGDTIKFPELSKDEWKGWQKYKNASDKRLQHQIYTRKIYT